MRFATVFIFLPILLAALGSHRATPVESLPPVVLWAWERPEDLTFVDPEKTGVAFLAKTITLSGDKVVVKPRLQPLKLTPGTKLVAVVRIETDRANTPSLSASQLVQVSAAIRSLGSAKSHVQIDFDATVSQRNFYRELLRDIRRQLPTSVGLSMTALASWCAGDDWLRDLPVDEAVPMLFRMGVEKNLFQRRLESGQQFESSPCRNTAGVSVDEPVNVPAVDRLYIFNPERWTKESFAKAMEAYKR
jgi:hypothetical protein